AWRLTCDAGGACPHYYAALRMPSPTRRTPMTHTPSAPSPDTGLARKAIDALLVSGSLAIWVIVYLLVAAISFLIYSGPDDIGFMLVIYVLLATVIAGSRFLFRNPR